MIYLYQLSVYLRWKHAFWRGLYLLLVKCKTPGQLLSMCLHWPILRIATFTKPLLIINKVFFTNELSAMQWGNVVPLLIKQKRYTNELSLLRCTHIAHLATSAFASTRRRLSA